LKAIGKETLRKSVPGAMLAMLCGLGLWKAPLGEPWVNASYDYLFRFGARAVTNRVTLILMDNEAYDQFHQIRGQTWDRGLHAQLLNRLADDGCSMVAMDCFFRQPRDPISDAALAAAMRRQQHIVLMAEQAQVTHPTLAGAQPVVTTEPFLSAAKTNWGVAWLDPDLDSIVRRHWPFQSPGPYPSLPWTAARLAGANLSETPQERWLRYYGRDGVWTRLSYRYALTEPTNYFRGQIVFVGTAPKTSVPDNETDKFSTPYTQWTNEATGGVEILLTSFLNLMNADWLRRPADWLEAVTLATTGLLLGSGLCRMRAAVAVVVAASTALAVSIGAIAWSYFTNYWFPWLVIAAGQVPCALAWAMAMSLRDALGKRNVTVNLSFPRPATAVEVMPEVEGYELLHPPFGEGAYGKVWLARNTSGQWRALKAVYLANFDQNTDPYEREFNGIKKYQPVSDQHPGLLRVEFVSGKKDGYFYYVMELGDSIAPGWEREPSTYKPRDLVSERIRFPGRRLPVRECVRIGLALSDALHFLHRQGLTHRDIKPQNIIFVKGLPKLADLGLITEIRSPGQERTLVGTPGYMPPPPERPGTPQADIYALGMVLYVLSTGRSPAYFPEIATKLVADPEPSDFFPLNTVILKACQPNPVQRYTTAVEMHQALHHARRALAVE
ncbi:MAG TPA: serine/threonine-protein kinase, partial [Candidatus Acidoferrum sp.]|nr:serine/threonine-protein kinase [Candidatus Acidoferrum sp.]